MVNDPSNSLLKATAVIPQGCIISKATNDTFITSNFFELLVEEVQENLPQTIPHPQPYQDLLSIIIIFESLAAI